MDFYDEEHISPSTVVTHGLMEQVNMKIYENQRFTIVF